MDDETLATEVVAFFDDVARLLANVNFEIAQIESWIDDHAPRGEMTLYAADRKERIRQLCPAVTSRWPIVADFIGMANASHRRPIHVGEDLVGGLICEAVRPAAELVAQVISVIGFDDEERTCGEAYRDLRVAADLLDRLPGNWINVSAELLEMERQRSLNWLVENGFRAVWPGRFVDDLRGNQQILAKMMNVSGGAVPIPEIAESCGWTAPYDDSVRGLLKHFNAALRKAGDPRKIHRHDGRIRVRPEKD
jgi:hypothetical protein